MRDNDRTSDYIGYGEYFIYLFRFQAHFIRLTEVVPDAVVTPQDHASYQSKHFLGPAVKCARGIGICIQVPESFNDKVVFFQDNCIHPRAVCIKFIYKITHGPKFITSNVENISFHPLPFRESRGLAIFNQAAAKDNGKQLIPVSVSGKE
jgi:hypothetical protein